MADFSDESDVNPEEMARMVEDLDDLENTLLGGPSKKQEKFTVSKDKEPTEAKKKVAFKDFDSDDPLVDLLSDEESSYEATKPSLPNVKSSLVADLFGIKNPKSQEKHNEPVKVQKTPDQREPERPREVTVHAENNLPISINKKSQAPIVPQTRSNSQNTREKSHENEDFIARTENSQKMPDAKARKSSLMEDLFGTRARSAPTKEIDAKSSLTNLDIRKPTTTVLSEPTKSEQSTKSTGGYTLDSGTLREPRRGRRNSPIISDPLGLFSAPHKPIEQVAEIVPAVRAKVDGEKKLPEEDLPEWLGGTARAKETKSETEKEGTSYSGKLSEGPPTVQSSVTSATDIRESRTNESTPGLLSRTNYESTILYPDVSTIIGSQFDQQAAIISMQQQEHELRTAANLSHQNEQVNKIVENQKAKLDEQGKMFDVLMKHQMERQSMLETQMKIQQARIDHYIQTLLSQPTSLPFGALPKEIGAKDDSKDEEKSDCPESLTKKLELENLYLENTLDSLKEKHEKDINILQESYEKQMLFLRQGMEKLEKRMYHDCDALENEYERKIKKLKDEKEELEQSYNEEIDRLKKNEKSFIEEIYDRHSHNVGLLQKEHAETINEISRAKELERLAVEKITSHKTDLSDLLQRSQIVIESFQSLQKKLEDKDEEFGETRSNYLKKQEENLQLLRDQLHLQQESLADERTRLMEISQRLDTATLQLTAEFKKNSITINESEERLAMRERVLIREKQLFDEQMRWEREHLQVIKEAWVQEQERQMKFISNEREVISNERAKSEVLVRLKNGTDDMVKVELEAALRTAQEATNEANQARLKWQEKTRALDNEKRALYEKEKHLVHRAKELENLTQSALAKREEGFQALKEAKRIEQRHKEHLGHLQMQLESFADRENKKATEKLVLARERLAMRMYPAEKPEKDTIERIAPISSMCEKSLISNSHDSTRFKDVVDPRLLLLKLNLDNKLDTTDELLAAMQFVNN